jgi:hypothetical protein
MSYSEAMTPIARASRCLLLAALLMGAAGCFSESPESLDKEATAIMTEYAVIMESVVDEPSAIAAAAKLNALADRREAHRKRALSYGYEPQVDNAIIKRGFDAGMRVNSTPGLSQVAGPHLKDALLTWLSANGMKLRRP